MKGRVCLFFIWSMAVLHLFPRFATAQTSPQSAFAPYLLPQTIFVGDQGRLVVPLGQAFSGIEPFVLEIPLPAAEERTVPGRGAVPSPQRLFVIGPDKTAGLLIRAGLLEALPEHPDLLFRRIELERRGGTSRLLIDFIPYAPGVLSFPPIAFASSGYKIPEDDPEENLEMTNPGSGGSRQIVPAGPELLMLTGLEVNVASILDQSQMVLADPAPPMSVPGTNLMVYGSLVLVLLLLFLGIACFIWARRHFRDLWERLRRRYLIRVMVKFLRRLRQECCLEKNGNPSYFLSVLSGEFREFLSIFTGVNCRSFSAVEFRDLPLEYPEHYTLSAHLSNGQRGPLKEPSLYTDNENSPAPPGGISRALFLCRLFRTWDDLRFSGRGIKMLDLFNALKETEKFIIDLDRAEREKPLFELRRKGKSGSDSTMSGRSGDGDERESNPAPLAESLGGRYL